jgi:capsular exopolysaccharide synthesis family protein
MEKQASPKPAQKPEVKLHFLDYWRIVRIRKTVILAVFLLVVLTTTAVTYILPKSYISTVRLKVEKDAADVGLLSGERGSTVFDPYFIQTEFEYIQSKIVLHKVIEDTGLNRRWAARYNDGVALKTPQTFLLLKNKMGVRQFRNTSYIEISVRSESADEAAEIANKIAAVYRDTRIAKELEHARRGIAALKEELKNQNDEVNEAQKRVDGLREDLKISDAAAEQGYVQTLEPETVRKLEALRIETQASYMRGAKLFDQLKGLNRAELRQALPNAAPDQQLNDLMSRLSQTEQQLTTLLKDLTEANPEIVRIAALQARINSQIEERIDGILRGLKAQVDSLQAQYQSVSAELETAKQTDYQKMSEYSPYFSAKRALENQKRMRDILSMKITQENIDIKIPRSSIVDITDPAEPGLRPDYPKVPLNIALGVIVGLIVGVGLAFFIEYLDTSVKTIDDVEQTLQAPVLGVIPQNVGSMLEEGASSPHAEAYRVLRTNLLFSRKDDALSTITVVSGGAGEGKSTTLFNLAVIFAQSGSRVLIVDSDLRRPSIHKFFRLSNSIGLTNYLLKQNTLEEVVQTTSLGTLDFLPSGKLPSSSMGILNSPAMKELVKEVKRRYDFVFFDSPPIMGVSDASILASIVDLSVQVIQYRKYPQAMTVRAKQMVEKVGGTLLGVVLNNINISQDSYYYYYSGYYYDYYSKPEDEGAAKANNGQQKKAATETAAAVDIKRKY